MHWSDLVRWWHATPAAELIWIGVGLTAQLVFSLRFLVQWVATERARASIVPVETALKIPASVMALFVPSPAAQFATYVTIFAESVADVSALRSISAPRAVFPKAAALLRESVATAWP